MTENVAMIPLSKLVQPEANVRRTGASEGLDELIASIRAHGILQSLAVRPVIKKTGKSTGRYEVIAGARRLAALRRLATDKRIDKHYEVPCRVLEDGDAAEVSLAENVIRLPLHPADQFDAFAKLHDDGLGAEEIAARFGVTPTVVAQRLKLAAVSPRLIAAYRDGEMTLEQLMAFAVTDDHAAQERVWFESPFGPPQPRLIRRALTQDLVHGSDRRARLVGTEAYEAAGGTLVRDLFDSEDEGYLADVELLERLAAEKLQAEAETIKAEGWAWVEALPAIDYERLARMRRVRPDEEPRSEEEQRKLAELTTRYDALYAEHGEDPPEEVREELMRLDDEIAGLSAPRLVWRDEHKKRAGAIVSLAADGSLRVERGLLKPGEHQSEAEEGKPSRRRHTSRSAEQGQAHSASLLEALSAHRTAGLRAALAGSPEVALTGLLHTLVLRTLYSPAAETCVDVRPTVVDLQPVAEDIAESPAAAAMGEHCRQWLERLPDVEEKLWAWLAEQSVETKLELLAYCAATCVDAVQWRNAPLSERRRQQADELAIAVGLDMADWWQPTREGYFDHVPKPHILTAVKEAVSEQAADNIARLKKPAMAARAAELVTGRRWLPEPLRTGTPAAESEVDE